MTLPFESVVIVGGAGFIGSHFCETLVGYSKVKKLTIFDNFSSGTESHIAEVAKDNRVFVVKGDVKDLKHLTKTIEGHDLLIHLASNPDIAKAATDPTIDFWEGTYLTQNVVEAMRVAGVKRIAYAAGSGVYGDHSETLLPENVSPMEPISTYGASKLAGEALICSYAHMFGISGCSFRFGNVVGPKQTHGVGFDFLRKLKNDPTCLAILGNGTQFKPYVHVKDVVDAVLLAMSKVDAPFEAFNVATDDCLSVKDIVDLALEVSGTDKSRVKLSFGESSRGWKGDVPVVRLSTSKIRSLGWICKKNSREAMRDALIAMKKEVEATHS